MALTSTESAYLVEIIGCRHPDQFSSELSEKTDEQIEILKADVAEWLTVRSDFDSIRGGKSGISSNPADLRKAIRSRVVTMLGVQHLVNSASFSTTLVRA